MVSLRQFLHTNGIYILVLSALATIYVIVTPYAEILVKEKHPSTDFADIQEKSSIHVKNIATKEGTSFCHEFSISNWLIKPESPTSRQDWRFNSTVPCPEFMIKKYPKKRQKLSLVCANDDAKLVASWTYSTQDVDVVEFGNTCLEKFIDNCCTGDNLVPNVVHYVWYADMELGFFQFLSFMSVLRFVNPCLFLFHGNYLPRGEYWDYFVSIYPYVIHVKRERPIFIFGHKLEFPEHSSDVMRIEAVQKYGGMYFDWDEIVLRPLEPLRKYEFVLSHEEKNTLGNQLIISKKDARFLSLWYDSYRTDYRKDWAWNSIQLPGKLSESYSDLIHIEGYNFIKPNWMDARKQIFSQNYDWSTNYAMHLYIRWYKQKTDVIAIRTLNTTIGSVGRHIIFGNKELCDN